MPNVGIFSMYGMYGLLANKKERNDGSHVHSLFEGQLCEIDLLDPYRKDHQSKMVDDVYSSSSFCSVHWLSQYKGERMTSSVTNECFGNGCKASDATRLDLKRHKWMRLILHLHSEHKTGKTWKRNDIIIIIRSNMVDEVGRSASFCSVHRSSRHKDEGVTS